MIRFINKFPVPALIIISLGLYLPFLGATHLFDWDEINFAESAREMMLTGDYFSVQVNFERFWEKPPLFFWLQVISMKLFGINEFGARFPNALFGCFTLILLYSIGRKEEGHRFGLIWAFVYLSGLLPSLYFKTGIIDPVFNFFIFSGFYAAYKTQSPAYKKLKWPLICGIAIGLAVITKGPVGLLLPLLGILVFYIVGKFRPLCTWKQLLTIVLSILVLSSLWFGYDLYKNGPWFLVEFIEYQIELFTSPVAGHEQPFYYHLLVVFIGCLPFSVFALPQFTYKIKRWSLLSWMNVLFWVVMILFSLSSTKIVHYSSMCYLPLSYLAARQVMIWDVKGIKSKLQRLAPIIAFSILALCLVAVPFMFANTHLWKDGVKDPFFSLALETKVDWNWINIYPWLLLPIFGVFWYLKAERKEMLKTLVVVSVGFIAVLNIYLAMVVPKVERYTQGPLIEFYKSKRGEHVYVQPYHYKSYAHLFYSRKPLPSEPYLDHWGVENYPLDRPAYLVAKEGKHARELETREDATYVGTYGGYLVFRRDPSPLVE